MDLIKIDVIHSEPLQAGVYCRDDRFARETAGVGPIAPGEKHFRGHDQLVTPAHLAQGATDDLFARAVGINVGGVEEINSEIQGARDERPALLFVQTPGMTAALRHAVGHATEAEPRDFESGFSESGVFHRVLYAPRRTRAGTRSL